MVEPFHRSTHLDPTIAERQRLSEALAVAAVLVVGVALRFFQLGAESYWVDEMITLRITSGDFDVVVENIRGIRPPLYILLAYVWTQLFGTAEAATRALPALISSLSLLVLYLLGRQLFGHSVGLIATALMACSRAIIFQAQNIRYYSLLILLSVLTCYLLVRWIEDRRHRNLLLYGISAVLLYYTHTYGIFIIIGFNLYMVLQLRRYWQQLGAWIVAHLLIIAAIGPHLLLSMQTVNDGSAGPLEWLPPAEWNDFLTNMVFFMFDRGIRPAPLALGVGAAVLLLGTVVVIASTGVRAWAAAARQGLGSLPTLLRDHRVLLVIGWLMGSVAVPLLVALFLAPIYYQRYTLGGAPAFFLLVALGIVQLRRVIPPAAAVGALLLINAQPLYDYYVTVVNEPWRQTAAFVAEHDRPGDVLLFVQNHPTEPVLASFMWYYDGQIEACVLPESPVGDEALALQSIEACLGDHQRAWLIMRVTSMPFPLLIGEKLLPAYERVVATEEYSFYDQTRVIRFDLREP